MHRMITADDGCRLWASSAGRGTPLIMCHGGPGLWDMFGDLAALLGPDVEAIRWDQRGCGRSERRGPYSVARSVADLDAVRRFFGFDTVSLLGHSWGAHLALRYALAHPDVVARLCYVSGTGLGNAWHVDYRRNLEARLGDRAAEPAGREAAIARWTAEFADPVRARVLAERMATPWFEVNYECNAALGAELRMLRETDLVEACRRLTVPTLILDGAEDIRPRRAVDSLERALPDVRRVTIEHAGHHPWLETPDEFRRALMGFLRRA
jgi:proline iminopeptidase